MKIRILFAEQFYYPEGWGGAQIPRDITIFLARSGFEVHVLCGSEQYSPQPAQPGDDPALEGVRIRRLPGLRLGPIKRWRMLRQLWFCLLSIPAILLRRWPHLIVAQTNPAPLVPTLALLSALMRVPLVIIAQDIYPEVMIADGLLRPAGPLTRLLETVFRAAYRRAHRVVSLGPRMTERLEAKGVASAHVVEISNWATGDVRTIPRDRNPYIERWGLNNKFVLLYSGNIGVAHDYQTMVRALDVLRHEFPQVHLVITGTGSKLEPAKKLVRALGLERVVSFHGLVPSEVLSESLGVAHLALVTLLPGFDGLVVPSKLLGHMARSIATLYIGPPESDVDLLVTRSGGGISVRNDDVQQTVDHIVRLTADPEELHLLGQRALEYYCTNLSREEGLGRYRRLAQEATQNA